MRHRHSGRQLNRNSSHRKAMFRNMSMSLIEHEIIRTSLPKAKELRRVIEPLITLAKKDTVANRRLAASRLPYAKSLNLKDGAFEKDGQVDVIKKLFNELGPRYAERPGGYIRIVKCGFRTGDKSPMAFVELIGRPIVEDVEIEDEDAVEEAAEA